MTEWEQHVGEGWRPIVKKACADLELLGYIILQVKEKFGGLRLYFACPDHMDWEDGDEIVRHAEEACWKTCEVCGQDGKQRDLSWIKTLCDRHYDERKEI